MLRVVNDDGEWAIFIDTESGGWGLVTYVYTISDVTSITYSDL
jgi:hypothetical protein